MTRLAKSIPILLLALLAGCASLGIAPADTFNKRILVANSTVESVATTIETLTKAGKLSKEDAQSVQDQAANAALGIDLARDVYSADPQAATTRLDAVIVALNAINTYLSAKQ